MRTRWPLLLGALLLAGCDITNPPDWTADYLFPLDFPTIDLSGIPGGVIPFDSVSFTTPVDSQDTEGLVGRILQSEDLAALRAEVILSTTLDVTGNAMVSVAPSRAALFDPSQSLTATVTIDQGTTTIEVPVSLSAFQGAAMLYFQAEVAIGSSSGSITVSPGDEIGVAVNFIGTVRVSK
jgi:hypothetical protein